MYHYAPREGPQYGTKSGRKQVEEMSLEYMRSHRIELSPAMKTLQALGITIANTYKLFDRSDWKYEIKKTKIEQGEIEISELMNRRPAEMKSGEEVLNVVECLWNKHWDEN